MALHTEPRTLNPDVAGDETADVVAANVFGRLVVVDVDGRLLPDLAERWTVDTEASRGLPSVPAIAATAYARAEDRSRALKAGYWSISASRWTPQR